MQVILQRFCRGEPTRPVISDLGTALAQLNALVEDDAYTVENDLESLTERYVLGRWHLFPYTWIQVHNDDDIIYYLWQA